MGHRESDWYLRIKDMPTGTRIRMPHSGCSIGDALLVTKNDKGCQAWCFLCKKDGMFVPAPAESLAAKMARISSEKAVAQEMKFSKALPLPKSENPSEWPVEARLWLYKAGLSNADIIRDGIYYHPTSGRVVIPVCDGESLVYWQARGFNPEAPKYLNPSVVDRRKLVANWYGDTRCLVLTEDWLSGCRVHHASGLNVYALLGTHLTDEIAAQIVYQKSHVAVWLDSDKAGQTSATKIVSKLKSFGVGVTNIVTPLDPKCYSNREIKEVLHEVSLHRPRADGQ